MNAPTQAVAVRENASPSMQFRDQLTKMDQELSTALPPHIPVERFIRVVLTAVNGNPDLLKADRRSLFESAMKAAQDGLLPDGRDGAFVTFGNRVQWMPMVGGILKKVRNSGDLLTIAAHVAYEKDVFKYSLGDDEKIEHVPSLLADRGKPMIVYAVAKTKDGGIYREVMPISEVEKVRNVSRAKNNGPWVQWWDEMAKKTVIRRLAKRLPMSSDLDDLIRRDDDLYDFTGKRAESADQHGRLFSVVRDPLSDEAPEISATDAHSQPDRMESVAGSSDGGDHVTASTLPDHAGANPGAETGQAGERPAPVSNSSQPLPPVDAETDTPASDKASPPRSDAGTNSESSGGSLTDDGAQAGADQDKPGAGLPPGWQSVYVKAMNAASDRPKSLQSRHTEALKMIGGEPSEADLEEMRAIYALRQRNLKGEISAEEYQAGIREIVGDVE